MGISNSAGEEELIDRITGLLGRLEFKCFARWFTKLFRSPTGSSALALIFEKLGSGICGSESKQGKSDR